MLVIAPYGMLQSLVRDVDLARALAEAARVLRPGGLFVRRSRARPAAGGRRMRDSVRLRGRHGQRTTVTLVESVRQDRRRGLTIFDEDVRRAVSAGKRARAVVRDAPVLADLSHPAACRDPAPARARRDSEIEAMFGGYRGEPWTPRRVWMTLASDVGARATATCRFAQSSFEPC